MTGETMHCKVCLKTLREGQDAFCTHIPPEGERTYSCEHCYQEGNIRRYRETGEITTSLMSDATLADCYLREGCSMDRLRTELRAYITRHRDAMVQIADAVKEIHAAERRFEAAVWLPRLQAYYRSNESRGHSADGDGFKVLLWGSAGRVLLTLQDLHKQGEPQARFGGANVTLIFDETSPVARGGIQSLAATKEEALGLIEAAIAGFPVLQPDDEVCVV